MLISVGIGVVVIAIGLAALVNALGQGPAPSAGGGSGPIGSAARGPAGWVQLPDPPLSARRAATAVWVGSMVVVVGGYDAAGCPLNADCALVSLPLSDGARYDAVTGTWTTIARAPLRIGYAETVIVGGTAFFWVLAAEDGAPTFMAYDVVDDAWRKLPLPPTVTRVSPRLVATSDAVIAYPGSNELGDRIDQAYDVASGTWRELPADPLTPSFDRTMVVSGGKVISLGPENVRDPGVKPPVYRAAVLDLASGAWRRLHDAPVVANDPVWFVAGGLVVNPSLGGADGGQVNNWGRTIPFGGMLDLEGEAWIGLPDPPPQGESFAGGPVGGAEMIVNREGWSLDIAGLSWQQVGGPPRGPDTEAATAWAGDHLFLFGGSRTDGNVATLLGGAWEWRPGGS
jgi:hypothetical protein